MIKEQTKRILRKRITAFAFTLLRPLLVPIIIIIILFLLVCYITDILSLGDKNKDKVDMAKEVKYYYSEKEYTDEDSKTLLDSVQDFLDSIFGIKFVNAEFPVLGKSEDDITSPFGYREAPTSGASTYHNGIDIAAKEGTELVAIMDGKVTKASWGGSGGYTITIVSGEYTYSYCHCSPEFKVQVGDEVKKGQIIGTVGPKNVYGVPGNPYKDSDGNPTNGATTGSHCHFTVRENGESIDPLEILK